MKNSFLERNIFKIFTVVLLVYNIAMTVSQALGGKGFAPEYLVYSISALALIIISVAFVFSVERLKAKPVSSEKDDILNLGTYEDFSDREIVIICKILQNDKYDYIARSLNLSEITVKKAAAVIFKKLDCTDKVDLFGKYANHTVTKGSSVFLENGKTETSLLKKLIESQKKD